jgi:hypothetical protein
MIELPQVTLVAVDGGRNPVPTEQSLLRSASRVTFGRVMCFSTAPLTTRELYAHGCEWVQIPPTTLTGYNQFCLAALHKFISTSHCLSIHSDSWIVTPDAWDPEWLDYDYVGAPWPVGHSGTKHRVGNSGFCLRSKQLLEATATLPNDTYVWRGKVKAGCRDDVITCVMYRDELERGGLRFAPVEVAARFSFELPVPEAPALDSQFGTHEYRRRSRKDPPASAG